MTHASCPDCQLRFTPATAAYLPSCPGCGEPLQPLIGLNAALGLRLFRPEDDMISLPDAIAVAMPTPDPHGRRP